MHLKADMGNSVFTYNNMWFDTGQIKFWVQDIEISDVLRFICFSALICVFLLSSVLHRDASGFSTINIKKFWKLKLSTKMKKYMIK